MDFLWCFVPKTLCVVFTFKLCITDTTNSKFRLQWRHNEGDSTSTHRPHDCLLNGLFRRSSMKTWKLRVTGLCAGNSPGTCEFPAQMISNAEDVSIWWHHHAQHKWLRYKIEEKILTHDDVIKWKHFPRNWPYVRGIHRSPVISPHKGQWRGALMFSVICVWINGWVNNREAGDLRRHRAHYHVSVMTIWNLVL